MSNKTEATRWMSIVLLLAGVYNVVWGALVVMYPAQLFEWASMTPPTYPQIWQCVGMIVGVYGVGYLIAAQDAVRYWPIVFVGLLGKALGPIGFVSSAIAGELPWAFGLTIVTNDLIWWIPFTAILYRAAKHHNNSEVLSETLSFGEAMNTLSSHRGKTLAELSSERPTMVVFLRHMGCTFCREALSDLGKRRKKLSEAGVDLAVVHMSEPLNATVIFDNYQLSGVHRFNDPTCQLYRAFGLERGRFSQLLSPAIWWRGFQSAIYRGHGFGPIQGDAFRMPGVFLLNNGRIVAEYRPETVADRPNYLELASGGPLCELPPSHATDASPSV